MQDMLFSMRSVRTMDGSGNKKLEGTFPTFIEPAEGYGKVSSFVTIRQIGYWARIVL